MPRGVDTGAGALLGSGWVLGLAVWGSHFYPLSLRVFLEALDPKALLAPLDRKEKR